MLFQDTYNNSKDIVLDILVLLSIYNNINIIFNFTSLLFKINL